ncbi:MAG: ATP-binding protein [Bacteroidales bacterium]|nr:ATP-binding protein [Bacteroidales bacterium]
MDSPFIYYRYVTGKNFFGRREDCTILGNLLAQGEHIVMYEPPKTGKTSVIQQTLLNLRVTGRQFSIGQFNLMNIRSIASFLTRLGSTALRTVATTPAEYTELIGKYLDGTHFIFDQRSYAETDQIISLNWDIDDDDIRAMLSFPHKIARDRGVALILILDEFQCIDNTEDGDKVCKIFEKVLANERGHSNPGCTYVFSGSMVNAMKSIFDVRRHFYRLVERLQLRTLEEKEIIDYVHKGFMNSGKEVDRTLLHGVCRLFRNNMCYINHLMAVCDSLSRGYIVEATMTEALRIVLSVHEPRFLETMNGLTTFQINLLKAILDGHTKFSASDIIRTYGLSSSANVKRLKDALMKKEIVTFNDKDEPQVIDPLFEYWVRKFYFEQKV